MNADNRNNYEYEGLVLHLPVYDYLSLLRDPYDATDTKALDAWYKIAAQLKSTTLVDNRILLLI